MFIPALALAAVVLRAAAEVAMPVTFAEVAGLPVSGTPERYRYGAEDSQFGELWLPEDYDSPAPLVILIYGGCWLSDYDLTYVRPLANALRDRGYAIWVPEYRRVGEPGGGWPGTLEDIAAAVDHVRELPQANIDLERIVLAGHSAGGHLALWASARPGFAESSPFHDTAALRVTGVIGLAAITDLAAYAAGDNSCQQVTPRFMGGMPQERPQRYGATSPALLPVPQESVLLYGFADTIVPLEQARVITHAQLVGIAEAGHFDLGVLWFFQVRPYQLHTRR